MRMALGRGVDCAGCGAGDCGKGGGEKYSRVEEEEAGGTPKGPSMLRRMGWDIRQAW